MRAFLLLALLATAAVGAEDPLAAAQKALAGDDASAKRSALRALGSKGVGTDEAVFAMLIGALGDRQAGEAASQALTSRAGTTPAGGAWSPGATAERMSTAWNNWYAKWKVEQDLKKRTAEAAKKAAPPPAATGKPAPATETATPTAPTAPNPQDPALDDLGRLDRISFTDGGSLLCFVRARRTDADGNLISVQIVHRDGHGSETLPASIIARIDEDVE